jgi:adenylate cyclase
MAQLVRNISQAQPANVGIDILFPERDRTSPNEFSSFYKKFLNMEVNVSGLPKALYDNDKLFAEALSSLRSTLPIYLGSKGECQLPNKYALYLNEAQTGYSASGALCNVEVLHQNVLNFGFINAAADSDGIFRRLPLFINYNNMKIPAFSLANLLNVDANIHFNNANSFEVLDHHVEMDRNSEVLPQFYKKYTKISAVDILNNQFSYEKLRGKIVLIGTSAIGLKDSYLTADGRMIAGVDIHATIIDNIMNDTLIVEPKQYQLYSVIASFLLSIVIFFLVMRGSVLKIPMVAAVSIALSILYWFLMFEQGVYTSLGYFLAPFVSYFFLISIFFIIKVDQEEKAFALELNRSHSATLDSMVLVAEMHDLDTGAHIARTKHYVKLLATHLYNKNLYPQDITPEKIELMFQTAPMHDVGKVGIPDAILKKCSRLSEDEFNVMKTHTTIGKTIIENAMKSYRSNDFLKMAYNIAHYHHEKYDGTGYPNGLKGDEIPVEARLMAIADVYDALISKRVYKDAVIFEVAEMMIINASGTHFDPVMVNAFIILRKEFRKVANEFQDK